MNTVVQALAALSEFVSAVQNDENLLKIIQIQCYPSVKAKTMEQEQLKTILVEWRNSRDAKHLPLQYAIGQLLPRVINDSETDIKSIKPEPLKNVIRKKNSSVRIDPPFHNKRHTLRIIGTGKRAV